MTAPGPVLINNLRDVSDALLFNVMPGEEYGPGIMNVIFGKVSPEAKLTFTMPNVENEQKMTVDQYPGSDDSMNSSYSEKHHFGYRWYDQNKVKPAFEFGFGLTYSKFEYYGLKITGRYIEFDVKNIGKFKASDIPQIYLSVPKTENYSGGYRSPLALKHFEKVQDLAPGEIKHVKAELYDRDLSYWSVKDQKWILEPGTYKVVVGASSRDIRMGAMMEVKSNDEAQM